jgi:hypothetical protein
MRSGQCSPTHLPGITAERHELFGTHGEPFAPACFFFAATYIQYIMITSRHIMTFRAGRLFAGD